MRWRGRKSEWTSLFVMHISSISLGMGPHTVWGRVLLHFRQGLGLFGTRWKQMHPHISGGVVDLSFEAGINHYLG